MSWCSNSNWPFLYRCPQTVYFPNAVEDIDSDTLHVMCLNVLAVWCCIVLRIPGDVKHRVGQKSCTILIVCNSRVRGIVMHSIRQTVQLLSKIRQGSRVSPHLNILCIKFQETKLHWNNVTVNLAMMLSCRTHYIVPSEFTSELKCMNDESLVLLEQKTYPCSSDCTDFSFCEALLEEHQEIQDIRHLKHVLLHCWFVSH